MTGDQGTSHVGPVQHLKNLSSTMKCVVVQLEKYVRASEIAPFNLATGDGHWMGVIVRQTRTGQVLVNVSIHPQDLTKLQLKDIKEKLKSFFQNNRKVNNK